MLIKKTRSTLSIMYPKLTQINRTTKVSNGSFSDCQCLTFKFSSEVVHEQNYINSTPTPFAQQVNPLHEKPAEVEDSLNVIEIKLEPDEPRDNDSIVPVNQNAQNQS